jgi:hypothetical protein
MKLIAESWKHPVATMRVSKSVLAFALVALTATPCQAAVTNSAVSAERVFDPKLPGASLTILSRADGSGSYSARIAVYGASGQLIRTITSTQRNTGTRYQDSWTGLDSQGRFVAPGAYTVRFSADGQSQDTTVNVVRLGVLAMRFEDGVAGNRRIRMAYHRPDRNVVGNPFAVDSAGLPWILESSSLGARCLDRADGSPLDTPAKYTDLASPPRTSSGQIMSRGRSMPLAYPQGSKPGLTLLMGSSAGDNGRAVSCGYPIQGVNIAILLGGSYDVNLSPGKVLGLELDALGSGLRKQNLNLDFRFVYNAGNGWRWVPGQIRTEHDCYTTLGPPSTSDGMAWVGALDLATRRGQSSTTNASAATANTVRLVNNDLGLVYDDRAGAPAYTDSPGGLESPYLDLGSFLDGRRLGSRVNCLDCAATVSTLNKHAGVQTYVVIIGWNFALHWIRGIGGSRFIHDLFGSHSFSYHAIASIDRGRNIHDACLSVDADSRPDRSPFQEGLPTFMDYYDYQRQLSPSRPPIQNVGLASTR